MTSPAIFTVISLQAEGPHSEIEEFRTWVVCDFRKWARREFDVRADGRARRRNGDLHVTLEVHSRPHEVLSGITNRFANVQFRHGSLHQTSHCSFKVEGRQIEYEFHDDNGDWWHGPYGNYEKCPYEDGG